MLDYIFQSLDKWPGEATPSSERRSSQFNSTWTRTLELLDKETQSLDLVADSLTIATFHPPDAITRSGSIRVNSRAPQNPGVVVLFEIYRGAERIKLQYECDRFVWWEDNVRAIALALEALRKVDRYGVGRAGAQYQGYLALPPAPVALGAMSELQAAEILCQNAGHTNGYAMRILEDEQVMESAYKQALNKVHPDLGGDGDIAIVNVAAQILRDKFKPAESHLGAAR